MSAQPAPRAVSAVFGVQMVLAAAGPGGPPARIAAGVALAAVIAGVFYRPAAPVAVLSTVAVLTLSEVSPFFTAVSGLSAAAYLVIRYAAGSGVVTTTAPTVIAMVGFAVVAVAGVAVPWRLEWVPLLGPAAVVAIVVLAAAGLFRGDPARYE